MPPVGQRRGSFHDRGDFSAAWRLSDDFSRDSVNGKILAGLAFTHAVPAARRDGHAVALGVDWGLNTLLSAGAARLNADATITALGSGAQYRAAGVLAEQHRLRRQGEQLHARASHCDRLIAGGKHHPLTKSRGILAEDSQRRPNLSDTLARQAARWSADGTTPWVRRRIRRRRVA